MMKALHGRFGINAISDQDKVFRGCQLLILVLMVVCPQPFLVIFRRKTRANVSSARDWFARAFFAPRPLRAPSVEVQKLHI